MHFRYFWLVSILVDSIGSFSAPLVDEQSLQGLPPEVSKANPEEFIHIFVSKSKELTEFLETMIKVRNQHHSIDIWYVVLLMLLIHANPFILIPILILM